MKEYEKWFAEEETKEIGGVQVLLPLFNIDYLPLFVMMEDQKTAPKAIYDILHIALKKSFPGISDEDIKKIPVVKLVAYFEAVMEANGIDVPKNSSELVARAQSTGSEG